MKRAIRRLVTVALFAFVVSALATQAIRSFRRHEAVKIPAGKSLLLFHAEARCSTCLRLEKTIRKLLGDNKGEMELVSIPYDAPENRDIAESFRIGTISVVLVEKKSEQIVRQRDLSHDVWENIRDDASMNAMLSREMEAFTGK